MHGECDEYFLFPSNAKEKSSHLIIRGDEKVTVAAIIWLTFALRIHFKIQPSLIPHKGP